MEKQQKSGRRPLSVATRVVCGLIFAAAAALVLLNIFGVVAISANIGILVALTVLTIIAVYSAFHLFWAGLFFMAATIITIMNANGLVFMLDGQAIGNIYIVAALLTVAFHFFFKKSTFNLGIGVGGDASTTFGSTVKYFEDELDETSLECNFGSIKAYFENAKLKNGEAAVSIECNFGNIELYIPKTWRVVDKVETAFGGTVEKNHASVTKGSPTLTLVGEVNFGGLTIVYI